MSETSKPQLDLGTPPGKLKNRPAGGVGKAIWILLVLQVVTLACLIVVFVGLPGAASRRAIVPRTAEP